MAFERMSSAASTRPSVTSVIETGRRAGSCTARARAPGRREAPASLPVEGEDLIAQRVRKVRGARGRRARGRLPPERLPAAIARCRSIGGPCARLASTTSTGAASRPGGVLGRGCARDRLARAAGARARPLAPPFYRWFAGGELNTCYNAVDRHVAAGGARTRADLRQPGDRRSRAYTFEQLREEVSRLAGALRALGVERGDTVVIYMPMVPEAVFAMLACARLGAIHSVVFGGFAARSSRRASTMPTEGSVVRVVRHRGRPPRRVQAAARHGARDGAERARHCLILQRAQLRPPCRRAAISTGTSWSAPPRPRRLRVGGRNRPALYPLHVGHDRTAEGRGARQRRARGRARVEHATCTAWSPARCSGPRPTSAGSSGTPTSSTRRCWTERRRYSTRASPSARPMRARSGAS